MVKDAAITGSDVPIIRLALVRYAQMSELSRDEEANIMDLLRRLNTIS
jgi:hypothetical protein